MNIIRSNNGDEKTAQSIVYENGTVWAVSTSAWGGNDKLQAADLGLTEDQIEDIFKLGSKSLIDDNTRIYLQSARSKVQGLMKRIGSPFLIRGTYWIPNKRLLAAQEGINAISQEQAERVEKFLAGYEDYQSERVSKYPVLKDAVWPSRDRVRRAFGVKYLVFEIQGTGIRESDTQELIEAKKKFQADLKAEYEVLKGEILLEAHKAIVDCCEDIAARILETGEKVTAATLKKPRAVIEKYLTVAEVFDSASIKAEVAKLEEVLEGIQAKELKADEGVASRFAESMRKIADDIGDLSGYNSEGRLKRKLNLNPDDQEKAA